MCFVSVLRWMRHTCDHVCAFGYVPNSSSEQSRTESRNATAEIGRYTRLPKKYYFSFVLPFNPIHVLEHWDYFQIFKRISINMPAFYSTKDRFSCTAARNQLHVRAIVGNLSSVTIRQSVEKRHTKNSHFVRLSRIKTHKIQTKPFRLMLDDSNHRLCNVHYHFGLTARWLIGADAFVLYT